MGERTSASVKPVSMTGFVEVGDEDETEAGYANAVALAGRCPRGYRSGRCPPCPSETIIQSEPCPPPSAPGAAAPGAAAPGAAEAAPEGMAEAAAPSPSALAGNYGAAAGPMSSAPNMIGDFFGGGARFFGAGALAGIQNASVGIAGGDRRFKIVEAESPIPTDRVFFNYNHFQNPLQDINGNLRNLDRYTVGIEKTLRDGLWSVELRAPFSSNYNSTQSLTEGTSLADTEFGDLAIAAKRFLIRREHFMVSTGLGVVFPTGQNWAIADSFGPMVEVRNEAVHLQPFLGAAWQPNDHLYCLAFTQIDFDTHGNTVLMRDNRTPGPLNSVGVFQEQNLLFIDFSVGYWLYKDCRERFITGLAPVVELHYANTMQNEDMVSGPLGTVGAGNPQTGPVGTGRRDILNLTAGLNFQICGASTLTVAAAAPLKTGIDREYDAEIIVQFNRRF